VEAGGPGGGYRTDESSEVAAMKQTQSAERQHEEPVAPFTETHDRDAT
jgi:hypothetical protein